jgi:hypothetical protein
VRFTLAAVTVAAVALLAGGVVPAHAQAVAVLQGLDKTTARIATIDAPIGQQVRYGSLLITARACVKHPPTETPENSAFLEIDELPPDAGPNEKAERIFSGWMFSSSPALSALENPVYDVSVLDCKDAPTAATTSAATTPGATTPAAPAATNPLIPPPPKPHPEIEVKPLP